MKWFRLYTDILDDPKLVKLSDAEYRRFMHCLAVAAEQENEGKVEGPLDDIAWRIRSDLDALNTTLSKLESLDIIKMDGTGFEFIHWKKRQFRSDNPTERWHKWKANVGANVGKVLAPTATEQSRAEQSNKTIRSSSDEHDALFDLFWKNYPRKIGKQEARKVWSKIRSPKEVIEKMKTVLPRQIESEQWTKDNGQYIPHPATYLRQGRWEDETII